MLLKQWQPLKLQFGWPNSIKTNTHSSSYEYNFACDRHIKCILFKEELVMQNETTTYKIYSIVILGCVCVCCV